MPRIADETVDQVAAGVARFASHLGDSLCTPVTIWRRSIAESRWVAVGSISPEGSVEGRLESLEALLEGCNEPDSAGIRVEWLDEALARRKPVLGALPNGGRALAVAVREGREDYALSAFCWSADDRFLVRLAAAAQREWRQADKIEELESENESFAAQLASDLEELSFLRSMVDRLADVPADGELTGMAARTLPVLNETLRSECIAYVAAVPNRDTDRCGVAFRLGALGPATNETLVAIADRFGPLAARAPLVRNWSGDHATTAAEQPLPGVRSIAMAPLASGKSLLGWIVAVNRQQADDGRTPTVEAPWQLASDEFGSGEATLLATTASVLAMHAANLEMLREKEQIMVSVVRSLVSAIEAKDPYTCGHSERVALFARRIAREMQYTDDASERLYLAALLHDVGKIGVSDAVLKKEGKLSDEEYREISKHPDEGWAILCDLEQLRYVLPGVLHHHERWDGLGYPDRLAGEAIPLDGRVLAVADSFDAMTSDRPYRKGMPLEKAKSILREGAGVQWDPACIDAFLACIDDLLQIQAEYEHRGRPKRTGAAADAALIHEVEGL